MFGFDLGAFARAGKWVAMCAVLALISACSSSGGGGGGSTTADDDDDSSSALVQYFFAGPDPDGETNDSEPWVTDGTDAGTHILANIDSTGASNPNHFVRGGDTVYFAANDGEFGEEIWKTDGTEGGTERVSDVNDEGASDISDLTAIDGMLYFRADEGTGDEPFVSDGTAAGTEMACDVNTDDASNPDGYAVLDDVLYFGADSGADEAGQELWSCFEGVAEMVTEINGEGNASPDGFVTLGERILFAATTAGNGRELWATRGSSDTTAEVMDINTNESTSSNPHNMVEFDGAVYFFANPEPSDSHDELWKSDGTEDGTEMVSDFGAPYSASAVQLIASDGKLYMLVYTIENESDDQVVRLFESDGTASGTLDRTDDLGVTLATSCSNPEILGVSNGLLLLRLSEESDAEDELWGTDFTTEGTNRIGDVTLYVSCG